MQSSVLSLRVYFPEARI